MSCQNINCQETRNELYKRTQHFTGLITELNNEIFWLKKPEIIRRDEERIEKKIIEIIKEDIKNKNNKYIVYYKNNDENKN